MYILLMEILKFVQGAGFGQGGKFKKLLVEV
jgi:hypothetical protein